MGFVPCMETPVTFPGEKTKLEAAQKTRYSTYPAKTARPPKIHLFCFDIFIRDCLNCP